MTPAYDEVYLSDVTRNLADLFDLAIISMGMDPDDIGTRFAASFVANAIEKGNPNYLSGKSAVEMLIEILGQDVHYNQVSADRTPEYWAGWVLAYAQWHLDIPFQEILKAVPLSAIISIYHPYHEAPESKTAKWIEDKLPNKNKLTYYRKLRRLSKKQLSRLSGVNIRSLNYYEADRQYLWKAKGETLYALAKALCCTIEDLLH